MVRRAAWIGEGRIALSGYRPAGVQVIDTHDWSVHTLDEGHPGSSSR